jgi:hypothetical protein
LWMSATYCKASVVSCKKIKSYTCYMKHITNKHAVCS